jgi:predicted RNA-binding protein YlxR (DUF448 family)
LRSEIDITGLDKVVILMEMVNSFDVSKLPSGYNPKYKLSADEARRTLENRTFFSYFAGRPLHIIFTKKDGRDLLICQKREQMPDEWLKNILEKAARANKPSLSADLSVEEKAVVEQARKINGPSLSPEEMALRSRIAGKESR